MSTQIPPPATAGRPRRLSRLALRARWNAMSADPLLASIPFKLELNERGAIEVSPATTRHAFHQAFLAGELKRLLPDGITFTECPVETQIGVRVSVPPAIPGSVTRFLTPYMPKLFDSFFEPLPGSPPCAHS